MTDPFLSAARRILGVPGRLVPYALQRPVLSLILNEALRTPLRRGEFDFLDGACIRIQVTDLHFDWLMRIAGGRVVPLDRRTSEEDVRIRAGSLDYALLATRLADPDTLFFQRRLRIEGDTERGLGIKNVMDSMDWDDLPPPLRRLLRIAATVIRDSGIARRRLAAAATPGV